MQFLEINKLDIRIRFSYNDRYEKDFRSALFSHRSPSG